MKKLLSIVAALVASVLVSAAAIAQTPTINGNTFQTNVAGQTVQGMVGMCVDGTNHAVPCGSSGTGAPTTITGSSAFGPVAPGAPTATSSNMVGCRFNSTANDTTANDQGAVGCDQRGGLYVQDGKQIPPASATALGTLFTVADTTGYGSISVQVTSAGVGATITYQASEDGVTWTSVNGFGPNYTTSSATVATSTSASLLWFPVTAKQFRAQITAYVSGTVTAQATLRKDSLPRHGIQVGINSGNNNVGGYNTSVTATPTIAASSHTAGTALGGLQTLAFLRNTSGSGIVNNVHWLWKTGTNLTAVTVYLFFSNPTGSTCTDANAISIAAADVTKLVAGSPFILSPAVIGSGSSFSVGAQQLPMSVKNGDSTTNIYACVAANATVTPAANDGVLSISGLQD